MSIRNTTNGTAIVLLATAAVTSAAQGAIVSYALNTTLSQGVNYGVNMETGTVHLGELTGDDLFLLAGSSSFYVLHQTVAPTSLLARYVGASTPSNMAPGFSLALSMSGASWSTGSAVTFNAGSTGAFSLNATNYVGVRFANSAGAYRYGYLALQLGATTQQCTVKGIAYEDSGGAITIVPAPGALALLAVASGMRPRRRH
jgi:hypothetical protein